MLNRAKFGTLAFASIVLPTAAGASAYSVVLTYGT